MKQEGPAWLMGMWGTMAWVGQLGGRPKWAAVHALSLPHVSFCRKEKRKKGEVRKRFMHGVISLGLIKMSSYKERLEIFGFLGELRNMMKEIYGPVGDRELR